MDKEKLIWVGRIAFVADDHLPEGMVSAAHGEPMRIGTAAKTFDKRITPP